MTVCGLVPVVIPVNTTTVATIPITCFIVVLIIAIAISLPTVRSSNCWAAIITLTYFLYCRKFWKKEWTYHRQKLLVLIKGPLKPNFLPNIRYVWIIFEGLGLFSSLWKNFISPRWRKKWVKFEKKRVSVSAKKISVPISIPILSADTVNRYQILVSH